MRDKFDLVFERLKQAKLSEEILCSEFWRKIVKLKKKFNEEDCWDLLVSNIEWVINTGTISTDDLMFWFTEDQMAEKNIFASGRHKVVDGYAIGIKEAKIEAAGHSKILLFDEAHCEAYDTTFVKGFNNSSMTLKNCTGEAFNRCSVTARDFSKVEAFDKAVVRAEGKSMVLIHDDVQVDNTDNSHIVTL